MEDKNKTFISECKAHGIKFNEWDKSEREICFADIHNDTMLMISKYADNNLAMVCYGKGYKVLFRESLFSNEVEALSKDLKEG